MKGQKFIRSGVRERTFAFQSNISTELKLTKSGSRESLQDVVVG